MEGDSWDQAQSSCKATYVHAPFVRSSAVHFLMKHNQSSELDPSRPELDGLSWGRLILRQSSESLNIFCRFFPKIVGDPFFPLLISCSFPRLIFGIGSLLFHDDVDNHVPRLIMGR